MLSWIRAAPGSIGLRAAPPCDPGACYEHLYFASGGFWGLSGPRDLVTLHSTHHWMLHSGKSREAFQKTQLSIVVLTIIEKKVNAALPTLQRRLPLRAKQKGGAYALPHPSYLDGTACRPRILCPVPTLPKRLLPLAGRLGAFGAQEDVTLPPRCGGRPGRFRGLGWTRWLPSGPRRALQPVAGHGTCSGCLAKTANRRRRKVRLAPRS